MLLGALDKMDTYWVVYNWEARMGIRYRGLIITLISEHTWKSGARRAYRRVGLG